MMLFQVIPLVALLALVPWFVRRRVGVLAWGALAINLFAFGLACLWHALEPYELCSIASCMFLAVCVVLWMVPLANLKIGHSVFVAPPELIMRILAWIVIVMTVPAALYFLPYIGRIFEADISLTRIMNKMDNAALQVGLWHRYCVTCAYLYVVALCLLAYGCGRSVFSSLTLLLLFVGSLAYPLSGIYLYSRGMSLLYAFSLVFIGGVAVTFSPIATKRKLRRWMFVAIIILAVPFTLITAERFKGDGMHGFMEYVGGGPRFFSRIYFHDDEWLKDPSALFLRPFSMAWDRLTDREPAHQRMLEVYETNRDLIFTEEDMDQPTAPFVTLCGTFLAEFPKWVVLLLHALVAWGFYRYLGRCMVRMSVADVMICGMYLVTCAMYPIGYMYAGTPGNMAWLLAIGMLVFAKGGKRQELTKENKIGG